MFPIFENMSNASTLSSRQTTTKDKFLLHYLQKYGRIPFQTYLRYPFRDIKLHNYGLNKVRYHTS